MTEDLGRREKEEVGNKCSREDRNALNLILDVNGKIVPGPVDGGRRGKQERSPKVPEARLFLFCLDIMSASPGYHLGSS